jgi:hypothetical protein
MRARNVLQLMQGGCVALIVVSNACFATPSAQALPKTGSCPGGYSTSGNYCSPGHNSRFAVLKVGSCPSGYATSGNYCLAGSEARHAVQKVGSCPSGYSTSGDYCLKNRG